MTAQSEPAPLTAISPSKCEAEAAAVHQVFKWILAGGTERDIREAIAKHFPAGDAQPLIVAAMRQYEKAGTFDAKIVTGWCFEAYRDLYRRMVEIGDFAGALRAVKLILDLSSRVNVHNGQAEPAASEEVAAGDSVSAAQSPDSPAPAPIGRRRSRNRSCAASEAPKTSETLPQ